MQSPSKSATQNAAAHVSAFADVKVDSLPFKPISADSHVTEPPNCFIDYIDPKYRDTAPHVVRGDDGGDFFVIDGLTIKWSPGNGTSAGVDPRKLDRPLKALKFEDIHRGAYDGVARVADQNRDGIGGEIIYPSMGMILCSHPDAEYKKACMDAYNRWLQEFQSAAPDRLFGLGQIAIRSVEEAVAEVQQMHKMGFRGLMMPGDPCTDFDYDDEAFDPLWEVASSLGMPLCFHILTSKSDAKTFIGGPTHRGKTKANYHHGIIRANQDIIGMFIWGGIFERFPKLKLVCAEGDAGWAPHFMYRLDHFWHRHRFYDEDAWISSLPRTPSDYFRENVYLTFQDDFVAFNTAELMNEKHLMLANDFPHPDSTWPWSQQLLTMHTKDLPAARKRAILRDNVIELYNLPIN
jgi:predicted TIM-barrel fold metal-dependent hydrolase